MARLTALLALLSPAAPFGSTPHGEHLMGGEDPLTTRYIEFKAAVTHLYRNQEEALKRSLTLAAFWKHDTLREEWYAHRDEDKPEPEQRCVPTYALIYSKLQHDNQCADWADVGGECPKREGSRSRRMAGFNASVTAEEGADRKLLFGERRELEGFDSLVEGASQYDCHSCVRARVGPFGKVHDRSFVEEAVCESPSVAKCGRCCNSYLATMKETCGAYTTKDGCGERSVELYAPGGGVAGGESKQAFSACKWRGEFDAGTVAETLSTADERALVHFACLYHAYVRQATSGNVNALPADACRSLTSARAGLDGDGMDVGANGVKWADVQNWFMDNGVVAGSLLVEIGLRTIGPLRAELELSRTDPSFAQRLAATLLPPASAPEVEEPTRGCTGMADYKCNKRFEPTTLEIKECETSGCRFANAVRPGEVEEYSCVTESPWFCELENCFGGLCDFSLKPCANLLSDSSEANACMACCHRNAGQPPPPPPPVPEAPEYGFLSNYCHTHPNKLKMFLLLLKKLSATTYSSLFMEVQDWSLDGSAAWWRSCSLPTKTETITAWEGRFFNLWPAHVMNAFMSGGGDAEEGVGFEAVERYVNSRCEVTLYEDNNGGSCSTGSVVGQGIAPFNSCGRYNDVRTFGWSDNKASSLEMKKYGADIGECAVHLFQHYSYGGCFARVSLPLGYHAMSSNQFGGGLSDMTSSFVVTYPYPKWPKAVGTCEAPVGAVPCGTAGEPSCKQCNPPRRSTTDESVEGKYDFTKEWSDPVAGFVCTVEGESIPKSSGGGGKCLPADARLWGVAEGEAEPRLMRVAEVRVGDLVLTSSGLSAVYLQSHADADAVTQMVRLETSTGRAVELSHGHYIAADGAYTAAHRVRRGSTVMVAYPNGSSAPEVVTRASIVLKRGLYNPHTLAGDLVVAGAGRGIDERGAVGVVVSDSSEWFAEGMLPEPLIPHLYRAVLSPVRGLFALHPRWLQRFAKITADLADVVPRPVGVPAPDLGALGAAAIAQGALKALWQR